MDPFLTQLAELCRTNRTGAKWVIVPSYSLGHTLGERLVLEGTDWANLRFTTPIDLALQMAAPFLVERGVDPSSEGLGPALIMSLLLELPETGGYFRNLAEQPKMAEALWATIRELRMAGLWPGDLGRESFESADKHAELCALLRAYEAYLAERHLADNTFVPIRPQGGFDRPSPHAPAGRRGDVHRHSGQSLRVGGANRVLANGPPPHGRSSF